MGSRCRWVWMPHPAHLCVARDCRFHLATYVGGYIVSTVGEYEPEMAVREIHAASRGIQLVGRGDERRADAMRKLGFETIGLERTYETMVFKAVRTSREDTECCLWKITGGSLDMDGYNHGGEAFKGHLRLCDKWAKKNGRPERAAR